VTWLYDLTTKLSSDASGIDLIRAEGLRDRLSRQKFETEVDRHQHSRVFWCDELRVFSEEVVREHISVSRRVQPQMVLLSRSISKWCQRVLKRLDLNLQQYRIFQPQYWIYKEALEGLERAARNFPESAAIQKNIVLGILGHGLLESLDEHALELEEIAQALDPLLVWDYRQRGRQPFNERDVSRAERFATTLLDRSREAESIPKKLRTLKGMLDSGRANGGIDSRDLKFRRDLLQDFLSNPAIAATSQSTDRGWVLDDPGGDFDIGLSYLEVRYLRLTLMELAQNDLNYGPLILGRGADDHPRVSFREEGVEISFRLGASRSDVDDNLKRLRDYKDLQSLMPPSKSRDVVSHGMGLYLANLASAVVGWRLSIEKIDEPKGRLSFLLQRVGDGAPNGKR
jgi:hypothetical protein